MHTARRLLFGHLGLIAMALGGLWLLQGLGLVTLRPILCFAGCAPVHGRSLTWTLVGGVALAAGVIAIALALRRWRT